MNTLLTPALPLYPYQRRWVQDDSRFKIAMFARQCGKTFTSTLELALDCARAEALGQRRRWVILSRGERQAREAMNEGVKLHLRAMQAGFREFESDFSASVRALFVSTSPSSCATVLPASAGETRSSFIPKAGAMPSKMPRSAAERFQPSASGTPAFWLRAICAFMLMTSCFKNIL